MCEQCAVALKAHREVEGCEKLIDAAELEHEAMTLFENKKGMENARVKHSVAAERLMDAKELLHKQMQILQMKHMGRD